MFQSSIFKSIKLLVLSAGVFLAATTLTSCSKTDECNDSCINGSCSDGDCVCNTGYSGKWCATYIGGGSSSSSGGSSSSGSSSSGSSSSGSSSSGSSSSGSSSSGSSSSGGTSSYKLTFWSDFSGAPISIYVSGSYAGQINQYYTSAPSCGATGCVTKTYSSPQSSIHYTAEDGTLTWDSYATATAGCTTWNLTR